MTYLLFITLAPSPVQSQIPHILLDIISLGVDAVYQDTYRTAHTCERINYQNTTAQYHE